jgi:hypothetical protein
MPLVGIKLGGETANIAHGVRRAGVALHRGEADKDRGDFLWVAEEGGFGDIAEILIGLKVTVGGGAAGVNDPLRDPLVVEVGDFLAQDKIFQQRRAAATGAGANSDRQRCARPGWW